MGKRECWQGINLDGIGECYHESTLRGWLARWWKEAKKVARRGYSKQPYLCRVDLKWSADLTAWGHSY
jgi:hypothetical protein